MFINFVYKCAQFVYGIHKNSISFMIYVKCTHFILNFPFFFRPSSRSELASKHINTKYKYKLLSLRQKQRKNVKKNKIDFDWMNSGKMIQIASFFCLHKKTICFSKNRWIFWVTSISKALTASAYLFNVENGEQFRLFSYSLLTFIKIIK